MPPLPVVPQVCKVEISGTYHDTQWVNIYYLHYTGSAPSASDLTNYMAAAGAAFTSNYAAEMSVDNEITGWKMTDLTSATGAVAEGAFSVFGVRTGDFQGANVCMVASLEINRRYRGGHPRKYLPWGTAGTMASGSTKDWDPAFVTDCETKFGTMLTSAVGITEGGTTWDQFVNVSYYTGNARRAIAQVDSITGHTVRSRICSQRRRLGKVGG